MSEQKEQACHTTGPWIGRVNGTSPITKWECSYDAPLYSWVAVTDGKGETVALVPVVGDADKKLYARQALIAAAPDLLKQHEWNKGIRDGVDALLAEAGFAEASSVRHQLAMMNFDAIAKAKGETKDQGQD